MDGGEFFAWCRQRDIALYEDDLGSGQSSLLRALDMPFDGIKIDRGFVALACHRNPVRMLEFIYHLTQLAHDISASSVIEGLDGIDLIEASRLLGTQYGQGYAIAEPMDADALMQWSRGGAPLGEKMATTPLGAMALFLDWEKTIKVIRPQARKEIDGLWQTQMLDSWAQISATQEERTLFKACRALMVSADESYQRARLVFLRALTAHHQRRKLMTQKFQKT
jgi:hypothetical protein